MHFQGERELLAVGSAFVGGLAHHLVLIAVLASVIIEYRQVQN